MSNKIVYELTCNNFVFWINEYIKSWNIDWAIEIQITEYYCNIRKLNSYIALFDNATGLNSTIATISILLVRNNATENDVRSWAMNKIHFKSLLVYRQLDIYE